MNLQKTIPLSHIYNREEDFSTALADNLYALEVGEFEDAETESKVGTRRADIVAVGEDGALVVENQFGEADWDHWGRLEAYARLKEAAVAALVAESFEDLMKVTCQLRNEDSSIGWYLIQAQANAHEELSFHHIVRPIDIQTEEADVEYSEFWEPIFQGELGELFVKPASYRNKRWLNEGWLGKTISDVGVWLRLTNVECSIELWFQEPNAVEHRDRIMALFPESDYNYKYKDTSLNKTVIFPVLNKGEKNRDYWYEMRKKLVEMGTDIYNKINESDL